uniref:Uncharacterized protein n=1 Tax=Siphoviridae sp. cttWj13 TaxID=2826494 RepID=A0A8S5QXN6_9CAUD|nr:MAG TPA: hypothetical protein [Siphoviridae sp. cttWj13]
MLEKTPCNARRCAGLKSHAESRGRAENAR